MRPGRAAGKWRDCRQKRRYLQSFDEAAPTHSPETT